MVNTLFKRRDGDADLQSGCNLTPSLKVRCREICDDDLASITELLTRGFPERGRDYWLRAIERLRTLATVEPNLKYGYLLESNGSPVGVILMLSSHMEFDGEVVKRRNVSSWYVEPVFRGHAALLSALATKDASYTYVNISPAMQTWPIIEAHGFRSYSSGQFLAVAALSKSEVGARMIEVQAGAGGKPSDELAMLPEGKLLLDHIGYGCIGLICQARDGAYPFIFVPISIAKGPLKFAGAQLVYCRSIDELVRFAGAIGRFLLRRGMVLIALDANGPVDGLIGSYRTSRGCKYFKGPKPPRLGDLAYTEIAVFGP
jgi:hypothetical protein